MVSKRPANKAANGLLHTDAICCIMKVRVFVEHQLSQPCHNLSQVINHKDVGIFDTRYTRVHDEGILDQEASHSSNQLRSEWTGQLFERTLQQLVVLERYLDQGVDVVDVEDHRKRAVDHV